MVKNRTSPAVLWPAEKLVPYGNNPLPHSNLGENLGSNPTLSEQ